MLWPFRGPPRLDWIQVEVTTECSADCRYCPRRVLRERWIERRLPLATFEALLPELRHVDFVHLQGWGEPLSHPDLLPMIRLAKKVGHRVGTTTNAMHFTPELAESMVEAQLDVLAFSLAGLDAVNDCIRRGTRIGRVRRAIEMVRSIRESRGASAPRIHVAYMLLRSRLADIEGIPALLGELGADEAVLSSPSLVIDPTLEAEACLADDEAEFAALETRLLAARAAAARLGCELGFHVAAPFRASRGCSENVRHSCVVTSAGEIVPCVFAALPLAGGGQHLFRGRAYDLPRHSFGRLESGGLREAWHSGPYREFRAGIASEDVPGSCVPCMKRFIAPVVKGPEPPDLLEAWVSARGENA